ncbi:MAG TPA: L-seryl-tRNA(Sec) selenium transferase [Blastocatellia bacterium]|nr:L-seryl-tRNA(Sec) selenium transferase [Blastocatellia bacterium]
MTPEQKLRSLPSIDALLNRASLQTLIATQGRDAVRDRLREVLGEMRAEFRQEIPTPNNNGFANAEDLTSEAERRLQQRFVQRQQALTQRVINATGVVLHTNLGRAPLSQAAITAITQAASGYCNLEYDLTSGARGKRGSGLEAMLRDLLGCEAAAVVNNCAAAVYLTLNTLAEGGEVIVSRGELIEIGGSFRLPDMIAKSGARIREVGTTNRTRLSDFADVINENTKIILRSHPSNYRIVGFTERPSLAELTYLARERGIPLFEDLGSGSLLDLNPLGIHDEPTVQHSLQARVPVVAFSGDKLLGGPQAGIILGEKALIERIKRNPMMRAFRVDKLIFSALEATLAAYANGTAITDLPAVAALHAPKEDVARRARRFIRRVHNDHLKLQLLDGNSVVGGGSAPEAKLPTKLISISTANASATELEERLRQHTPPIIARIEDDKLLLDLRTVAKAEEAELIAALQNL